MGHLHRIAGVLLVLFVSASNVSADDATVYRWTDATGRTHFSDRPPETTSPRVEQFVAPSYAGSGLPSDHYSVTKQLERLQAERRERERLRLERERESQERALREREVAAAELAARRAADGASTGGGAYLSPSWGYGRPDPGYRPRPHRPTRPPSLWEPEHPAYRPYPQHPRPRPVPTARARF